MIKKKRKKGHLLVAKLTEILGLTENKWNSLESRNSTNTREKRETCRKQVIIIVSNLDEKIKTKTSSPFKVVTRLNQID